MTSTPEETRRTPRSVEDHATSARQLLEPTLARLSGNPATATLDAALGRVLAAPLAAPLALPSFDNSQMDGYAARSTELPGALRVTEPIAAGHTGQAIAADPGPGWAVPIMTGAMLPAWADAVVPVESARPARFVTAGETIELPAAPAGQFVRKRGEDVRAGEEVLPAGTVLGPAQIALLAALGRAEVAVRQPLRVALLSTGDELVSVGEPLPLGRIYDSNGPMLAAALRDAGAIPQVVRVQDDSPVGLREVLAHLEGVDLVLSTGGISQGAFEVVKLGLGTSVEFGAVAMQPGGPQAHGMVGTADGPVPFLGFPGNPVSSLLSFEVFLRPLLAGSRPRHRLRLAEAVDSPRAKHQIRRGVVTDDGVRLEGGPGSHLLRAMALADCLVHLPVGLERAEAGSEVEVWTL
ncbi:gephyrin-like molybdotransferase Glp [Arthrobacter sp. NPDC090010]|uniref:molybdopterin molybdotransferase MoeA n=1 Tax=Arthrobacter sp. NPDC090010 TaxID=3363942 RepID=UPI00382C9BFA